MQKLIFLTALLLFSANIFAQKIHWGQSETQKRNHQIQGIISEDETGIFVLNTLVAQGRTVPVLSHYSPDLKLQYRKRFKSIERQNVDFQEFFEFGDRLLITFTQYKPREDKYILFYQEVNKLTGELMGQGLSLASSPSRTRNTQGRIGFALSPDSTKAVIFFSETPQLRNAKANADNTSNKFSINVLDSNLNEIWKEKVTLSYDENLYEHRNLKVDNEGNVYVLAKIYNEQIRERSRGKANYLYKIIALNSQQEKIEYDLYLDGKFISDITFRLDRITNDLICSGFYSERNSFSIEGSFFFKIQQATNTVVSKDFKPFSVELRDKFMRRRSAERGREIQNFTLRDMVVTSDGGAILIAEQFFVSTQQDPFNPFFNNGGFMNQPNNIRVMYNFNEIFLVKINADGSIAWDAIVFKQQQDAMVSYCSFEKAFLNDTLHLIFNNRLSRRGTLDHATISPDGQVDYQVLFKNQDAKIFTRIRASKQVADDEIILYGDGFGQKFKIGRLQF